MSYILITPTRNEEANLPRLAECITKQTILPKVWVIVDGGSIDNTLKIIEKLTEEFHWIYLKKQEKLSNIGGHINFALGVKEGYEYAKDICINKKIDYDYVGKVDADVLIPKDHFEKMIEKFEKDPQLGVASGIPYTLKLNTQIKSYEEVNEEEVNRDDFLPDELPDKRLYRKGYLEEVGGFPESKFSPDTVLLAKFRLMGWKVRSFEDIKIYNLRKDTGIEKHVWKSSKLMGRCRYYLNYHPLLVLLATAYLMTKKPYYPAIAYCYGYCLGIIKREEKIDDQEIRDYFRHKRLKEIKNILSGQLKRKFYKYLKIQHNENRV